MKVVHPKTSEVIMAAKQLDVMTVIESRKMAHASHPTQATKPMPPHIQAAIRSDDVTACIGKATLTDDGKLFIQLKALPLNGRLVISLPK
jgi:hypothetical protein